MWQFVLIVGWLQFCPTAGVTLTQVGCDGNNLSIQCSTGTMTVLSVTFGRQDFTTCPGIFGVGSPQLNLTNCFCSLSSPVTIVMSSCNGKPSCLVNVYGPTVCAIDPCVGTYKYLSVTYSCPDTTTKPLPTTSTTTGTSLLTTTTTTRTSLASATTTTISSPVASIPARTSTSSPTAITTSTTTLSSPTTTTTFITSLSSSITSPTVTTSLSSPTTASTFITSLYSSEAAASKKKSTTDVTGTASTAKHILTGKSVTGMWRWILPVLVGVILIITLPFAFLCCYIACGGKRKRKNFKGQTDPRSK